LIILRSVSLLLGVEEAFTAFYRSAYNSAKRVPGDAKPDATKRLKWPKRGNDFRLRWGGDRAERHSNGETAGGRRGSVRPKDSGQYSRHGSGIGVFREQWENPGIECLNKISYRRFIWSSNFDLRPAITNAAFAGTFWNPWATQNAIAAGENAIQTRSWPTGVMRRFGRRIFVSSWRAFMKITYSIICFIIGLALFVIFHGGQVMLQGIGIGMAVVSAANLMIDLFCRKNSH
jgi:hypothetical protein